MPDHTGGCLCGAVTFVVTGSPVVVAQCHCTACRRLSGTGHTVGAMVRAVDVTINGALCTFEYVSDVGSQVTRAFCPQCGSPIYGQNSRAPEHLTLPLGALNDAADLSVEVVIFARDRPHWDALGSDVTTFDAQPDWTPDP